MKALIFVLFAFLLPSCSLFEPVTDPVTTRTTRLVEGYTPSGTPDLVIRGDYTTSVIRTDTFPSPYWMHRVEPPFESESGVVYYDSDARMYRRLDISPKGISYPNLHVRISMDRDSISLSPCVIDYEVVSPESSITIINVNKITSTITGYSYDSDGRSTEFILSCTLSPWNRDNEQVYDTVFGPLRIVTDSVIFLPYRGRISIGGREWQIK